MFTIELLQAINDWQRGGDAKQKKRRGEDLKKHAASLPKRFRQTTSTCYRQIALDKSSVWQVGTEYKLREGLSAWTTSETVAREFKGGVPPIEYQGIIFAIKPGTGSVVVNLAALFRDKQFQAAIHANKAKIATFDKGLGKYAATQSEVVIETNALPLDSVHSWGGYSSPEPKLAEMFFDAKPTSAQLQASRKLMAAAGHSCGPYWLTTPSAVARVSKKLKSFGQDLAKTPLASNERT